MRMLEPRRASKSYGQGTAEVRALREVSLSADGERQRVAIAGAMVDDLGRLLAPGDTR